MRSAPAALALLLAAPAASAQPPREAPVVISDSANWIMTAANGRRYRISAAWPRGAAPARGFPIVYTLDADLMFATMVDTVRALGRRPDGVPAIVIGIGYPDGVDVNKEQSFDLTPRLGSPEPKLAGTGAAEGLLSFIERELKPEIGRRFSVDAENETIFGHSFGGLFVLYALINRPALFDRWAAASPSLWFEDRLMFKDNVRKRLTAKLADTGATPRALLMAGEYEQAADPDFPPPRLAMLMQRKQVDNGREFAGFLAQPGVGARFELIAGEDHGTVIPAAITRAVRFAFAPRAMPSPAPKPAPFVNRTGVPIPDAARYVMMTPDERYTLRLRSRRLPDAQHKGWVAEFDRVLSAGLSYGAHRRLAEEREEMDVKHGTRPRPE